MIPKINQTIAVIMAAGKGIRMKSKLPKVLHPLLGRPMVSYVIEACQQAKVDRIIIVVGNRADLVQKTLGSDFEYAEQTQQLGTGHALMTVSEYLKGFQCNLLVLAGDTPLLTGKILRKLIGHHQKTNAAATFMTAIIDQPPAYGRIIRDKSGKPLRIVEERDATVEEKKITEVNTSHYCFKSEKVVPLLSKLNTKNVQGEYLLTDIMQLLVQQNERVETLTSDDPNILVGINSRLQLTKAHQIFKEKIIQKIIKDGATILDPNSVYIEPDVKVGHDTVIYPFTTILGKTIIGFECIIGPQVKLIDSRIGNNCRIEFSVIENRKIEKGALIGPFAYMSGPETD